MKYKRYKYITNHDFQPKPGQEHACKVCGDLASLHQDYRDKIDRIISTPPPVPDKRITITVSNDRISPESISQVHVSWLEFEKAKDPGALLVECVKRADKLIEQALDGKT